MCDFRQNSQPKLTHGRTQASKPRALTTSFSLARACSAIISRKLRVGVCPANASPPRMGEIYFNNHRGTAFTSNGRNDVSAGARDTSI